MARPKGSKNKPKDKKVEAKPKAKAKAKVKPPQKAEPPDWLRKAMAPTRTRQKRGPRTAAVKEKAQTLAKAKRRGRKPMATNKPLYDPMDDPDLRAPDPKDVKLDQSLPPKQHKPTPLVAEVEPEPAPLFDEVAAGEAIPYDNVEMLIAGTLGGSGDNHASAKHILGRFAEANWLITKGDEGTPAGRSIKSRKEADAKGKKETKDEDRKEFRGKATKEGDDATF